MRNVAGILLLGLLTACAPAATTPRTQLAAQATVQGGLLTVTVVNVGPYDVLLEDTCPRPFTIGYNVLPVTGGTSASTEGQPCVAAPLPPRLWRVGEGISSSMTLALSSGTQTLEAWARPQVRLAPGGKAQGAVRTLNVVTPAFTLMVP
ncbi:hypothetical protein E5F05_11435 [Deinococcus metallilatus]|uniref:DUF4232 domain-containing protein n=1 Tax=Deinococcus metallilatus TaxID=1211322 RepID=A0AAJ5JZF0_9DEIO|nr:hypothetical protein [Deinococcus metallilatus]MBB5296469.1 hypothetical protein [Deinococcus metallilatus]QBY08497.1 hypothetical protein E5F05_11435 [Deinococcus metallilatus]RXJ11296.1 hypothetical protein ERJ73_10255 [Deinococcus metallilatus]TLK24787.1 hypothetical protein FCS05_14690 [Deinococcus metallilatus]GMA17386.1 hypothetical protein GCM10025871_37170 [Deinococcus metallilatus]